MAEQYSNIDPVTGKRKRGRPRKVKIPDTIQDKIEQIIVEQKEKEEDEYHEVIEEVKREYRPNLSWDVPASVEDIPYFDLNLSYEATGYKPIDKTHGLDFRPEWFTEARDRYLQTGHYCQFVFGSKLYNQFWQKEYERCRKGMTVNGYTITGYNYFFLNYYQLKNSRVNQAGAGREMIFPRFFVYQYEFFHYFELCRIYRYNCGLMKSRGLGFSEISASIFNCLYSCYRNSISILTAATDLYVGKTMDKITSGLTFLNDHTDMGFFKLRQIKDSVYEKEASYYKYVNGQKVPAGFMSLIEGIVADNSRKIRGDRADIIMYEEAGSNPDLIKSIDKGEALINVGGNRVGVAIIGGTGGDEGPYLMGLREVYYKPEAYHVLPFKHNFTQDNSTIISSFFIPAFKALDRPDIVDERGWCDPEKGKQFYNKERDKQASDPKKLISHCAEFCFNAEEAFALEGTNKFNKTAIANLIAYIRLHKGLKTKNSDGEEVPAVPEVLKGELRFLYKAKDLGIHRNNIAGVEWIPGLLGTINIIEPPLWEMKDGKKYKEMAGLYVAGIDSIDMGKAQTSDYTDNPSKFCIIIYKRAFGMQDPVPVAYYMDRPEQAEEAYLKALKLMIWYNCRCNIEATRLTMWNYSKNRGFADYFMVRPRATYMDVTKKHSRTIGTPATPYIIDHQTDLIAHYTDDYCNCIWFPELLDLLNRYTNENKSHFDMIAAFGMALLADEELSGQAPREVEEATTENWTDIGWYTDERGYKHWGTIPKKNPKQRTMFNWHNEFYNPDGLHGSDPRYTNAYDRE